MTTTKYFIDPFAQSGDVLPIPDDTQPSGAMSYNEGFTLNYQLPQTDPSSLDVPRAQFNQLINDITLNIQQYQQVGAPNFITTSQNGGSPFPYNKYSIVTYDDGTNGPRTFMSLINSNTNLPTVTSAWWWVDFTSSSVVIANAAFDGAVNQGDAVYWDHTSSTFKQALANGAAPQNVVGFADKTFARVFTAGDVSFLSGLTAGSIYYLSSSLAGQITNVVPALNVVQMGFAKSSNELLENIQINRQSTSSFQAYFRVGITADVVVSDITQALLAFNQVYLDNQSGFDTSTSKYTVSVPGIYKISLAASYSDTDVGGQTDHYVAILVNSIPIVSGIESVTSTGGVTPFCECIIELNSGDLVSAQYGLAGGSSVLLKRNNDFFGPTISSPATYMEAIKIY